MKVFKFGGASIKTAESIINMVSIIKNHQPAVRIVVVSAMDKTTNSLERLIEISGSPNDIEPQLSKIKEYHLKITAELFGKSSAAPFEKLDKIFEDLKNDLRLGNKLSAGQYYDVIVSKGEMLSSTIISAYLKHHKINAIWVDASKLVITDNFHGEANVNWDHTNRLIKDKFALLPSDTLVLTQGFIGSDLDGLVSTLGREGSDYTAAIFASALGADSVTIWKDVPGILNADPKKIKDAVLFDELSYQEAAEMTYYGAKVIHPKTIKPLANRKIPLFVKGFDHPERPGTTIHDCQHEPLVPSYIYLENQCLFSFKVVDFAFVNENSISRIFAVLDSLNIKINMMQNSAISFSVCFDYQPEKVNELKKMLSHEFQFYYNTGLNLITIKNYTAESLKNFISKNLLLEQRSRKNFRILVKE